jgi:hypothetical protein
LRAAVIASELERGEKVREGLAFAGEVHDMGKVAMAAEILSKPAALNEIEVTLVRQHAETGREILAGIHFRQPVATSSPSITSAWTALGASVDCRGRRSCSRHASSRSPT